MKKDFKNTCNALEMFIQSRQSICRKLLSLGKISERLYRTKQKKLEIYRNPPNYSKMMKIALESSDE
jgi:hypothetical protein